MPYPTPPVASGYDAVTDIEANKVAADIRGRVADRFNDSVAGIISPGTNMDNINPATGAVINAITTMAPQFLKQFGFPDPDALFRGAMHASIGGGLRSVGTGGNIEKIPGMGRYPVSAAAAVTDGILKGFYEDGGDKRRANGLNISEMGGVLDVIGRRQAFADLPPVFQKISNNDEKAAAVAALRKAGKGTEADLVAKADMTKGPKLINNPAFNDAMLSRVEEFASITRDAKSLYGADVPAAKLAELVESSTTYSLSTAKGREEARNVLGGMIAGAAAAGVMPGEYALMRDTAANEGATFANKATGVDADTANDPYYRRSIHAGLNVFADEATKAALASRQPGVSAQVVADQSMRASVEWAQNNKEAVAALKVSETMGAEKQKEIQAQVQKLSGLADGDSRKVELKQQLEDFVSAATNQSTDKYITENAGQAGVIGLAGKLEKADSVKALSRAAMSSSIKSMDAEYTVAVQESGLSRLLGSSDANTAKVLREDFFDKYSKEQQGTIIDALSESDPSKRAAALTAAFKAAGQSEDEAAGSVLNFEELNTAVATTSKGATNLATKLKQITGRMDNKGSTSDKRFIRDDDLKKADDAAASARKTLDALKKEPVPKGAFGDLIEGLFEGAQRDKKAGAASGRASEARFDGEGGPKGAHTMMAYYDPNAEKTDGTLLARYDPNAKRTDATLPARYDPNAKRTDATLPARLDFAMDIEGLSNFQPQHDMVRHTKGWQDASLDERGQSFETLLAGMQETGGSSKNRAGKSETREDASTGALTRSMEDRKNGGPIEVVIVGDRSKGRGSVELSNILA